MLGPKLALREQQSGPRPQLFLWPTCCSSSCTQFVKYPSAAFERCSVTQLLLGLAPPLSLWQRLIAALNYIQAIFVKYWSDLSLRSSLVRESQSRCVLELFSNEWKPFAWSKEKWSRKFQVCKIQKWTFSSLKSLKYWPWCFADSYLVPWFNILSYLMQYSGSETFKDLSIQMCNAGCILHPLCLFNSKFVGLERILKCGRGEWSSSRWLESFHEPPHWKKSIYYGICGKHVALMSIEKEQKQSCNIISA